MALFEVRRVTDQRNRRQEIPTTPDDAIRAPFRL